ncbi:MAG: hypothetical protein ACNA8W_17770 [Bradymonadaceae bacterium]
MTEEVELITPPRRPWKIYIALALAALLLIIGFGAIGQAVGTGWFGHRPMLYGTGELYILNLNDEPRYASVDGQEAVEVPLQNAQIIELIGGTSKVDILDENRQLIETFDITIDHSHALLNLSAESCLVVADVAGLYGGRRGDLTFTDKLRPETRVYVPETTNVIWPRRSFPPRLDGAQAKAVWIEIVGCALLDEPEFLQAYLDVRLEQRMERLKTP